MKYYLKLECENGYDPTITLNETKSEYDFITDLQYKLNSLDPTSVERGTARAEFYIKGNITPDNYKELTMISEWSFRKKDHYMILTIGCIDADRITGEPAICRTFKFDCIFCIQYSEKYNDNEKTFELVMAQSPLGVEKEVATNI